MKLDNYRNEINNIDNQIANLFKDRLDIVNEIAEYKKENNISVASPEREKEVIEEILKNCPDDKKSSCKVLFKNIMDISKCKQQQNIYKDSPAIDYYDFMPFPTYRVGCQGTKNSYSYDAGLKLFSNSKFEFYSSFEDIFEGIENDELDFGILPIQNSTVGSVYKTYELMKKYNFYINAEVKVKVDLCLAVKNDTDLSLVFDVYSHEQALAQCSEFIKKNKLHAIPYSNTALAAEKVVESDVRIAAICSEKCANELGLKIAYKNITNSSDNYTRFICISKKNYVSKDANIVSVSLSLPHSPGALYRLLTTFSVIGLNLLRIESKPIASKDFNVIFYLDFEGSIKNPDVVQIINALSNELPTFKYLGNYSEVE